MNATNKTKKPTLRQLRAACLHPTTIELLGGAKVCTCCTAVLR